MKFFLRELLPLCWHGFSSNLTFGASPDETTYGADLGGSSKYLNENFEDQSGERFHGHGLVNPKT